MKFIKICKKRLSTVKARRLWDREPAVFSCFSVVAEPDFLSEILRERNVFNGILAEPEKKQSDL